MVKKDHRKNSRSARKKSKAPQVPRSGKGRRRSTKTRFQLSKKKLLGKGGWGFVQKGYDNKNRCKVAVKFQRQSGNKHSEEAMKTEVSVLRALQHGSSKHACRLIDHGCFDNKHYVAMTLLGKNITEIRQSMPNAKFSLHTTMRLGTQCLKAIEDVHRAGFLHRDISPNNFAVGVKPNQKVIYIIDFGLARPHSNVPGQQHLRRDVFCGQVRYASVNVHSNEVPGRRDDVLSLMYVLAECFAGTLPWHHLVDRNCIGEMKKSCTAAQLFGTQHYPVEIDAIFHHLRTLSSSDRPIYQRLQFLLNKMIQRTVYEQTFNEPFEWEKSIRMVSDKVATGHSKERIEPPLQRRNQRRLRQSPPKQRPKTFDNARRCEFKETNGEGKNQRKSHNI